MAEKYLQQVDILWKRLYDLLNGPGRAVALPKVLYPNLTSASIVPDGFNDELLHKVAALKRAAPAYRSEHVAEIRGILNVSQTIGLIGPAEEEQLQKLLDELET